MNTHRELAAALSNALNAEAQPPVPLQALVAGSVICARGGAPTRLGMAKLGGYSYGSSQNHYADLLDAIVGRLPAVVAGMAAGGIDPATTARLAEEVRRRDETIAALRRELKVLTERCEHVRRYALALHERVRALEEQGAGEAGEAAGLGASGGF